MSDQQAPPETTTPPEGQPSGEQPQGDPGIVDQLTSRFDQLEPAIGEIHEWVQNQQQPPEQPQFDQYGQPFDPYQQQQQGQPQFDPFTGEPLPPQQPPSLDAQQIQQMIQQGINQGLAPMQQHMLGQQLNQLADRYPELRTPEVLQQIDRTTGQIAQRMGNPALATDPQVVEMAFKAYRADQLASQQTPAGQTQDGVTLETSTATPSQEPTDPADELFGPRDPNVPTGPFRNWAQK